MKNLRLVLLFCFLTGCSSNPNNHWAGPLKLIGLSDRTLLERTSTWALSKESRIYVVLAENELLDQEFHSNLIRAIQRYFPAAIAGSNRESLEQALDSAILNGQDFLIYPRIWQRRDRVGWNKIFRKEVNISDIQKAEFKIDLALFAVQPGFNARIAGNTSSLKSVDSVQFQSIGSVFTGQGDEMLWSSLDKYLRYLSQY